MDKDMLERTESFLKELYKIKRNGNYQRNYHCEYNMLSMRESNREEDLINKLIESAEIVRMQTYKLLNGDDEYVPYGKKSDPLDDPSYLRDNLICRHCRGDLKLVEMKSPSYGITRRKYCCVKCNKCIL